MKPKRKSQPEPAYRNPKLSVERRVKDLLSRMTLEEKAAQMICVWQQKSSTLVDEKGRFDPQKAKSPFQGSPRPRPGRPAQRRRRRHATPGRWRS